MACDPRIAYLDTCGGSDRKKTEASKYRSCSEREIPRRRLKASAPLAYTASRAVAATIAGGVGFILSLVTVVVIHVAVLDWRAPSALFAALGIACMNAYFLGREAVRYLDRPVE